MNSKGSYAAVIVLVAVVVIVVAALSSSAAVNAQGQKNYAKAIVEVKREWQNFRYLLDKSAADALADASFDGGCGYNAANLDLGAYFSNVKDDSFGDDCTYDNLTIDDSDLGDIIITVSIACGKNLGGDFSVSYSKDVTFNKALTVDGSGTCPDLTPRCRVIVQDKQSSIDEVDQDNCL